MAAHYAGPSVHHFRRELGSDSRCRKTNNQLASIQEDIKAVGTGNWRGRAACRCLGRTEHRPTALPLSLTLSARLLAAVRCASSADFSHLHRCTNRRRCAPHSSSLAVCLVTLLTLPFTSRRSLCTLRNSGFVSGGIATANTSRRGAFVQISRSWADPKVEHTSEPCVDGRVYA